MSALLEHQLLALGLLSVYWTSYFSSTAWTIVIPILLSLYSMVALYLSFAIEQKWALWNCEKPTFWMHQLKAVNRLPQMLGFWCTLLPFTLCLVALFSNQQPNYFPISILVMVNLPLTLRFILFHFLRRWKLSSLLADVVSTLTSFCLLHWVIDTPFVWALIVSVLPSILNTVLIPKLMTAAAKSFTLGEFHLIYSGVVLALTASITWIASASATNEFNRILLLLAWSVVACTAFGSVCFTCSIVRRSAIVFWMALFVVAIAAYLLCLFTNGLDLLSWMAEFLIFGTSRQMAYCRWTLLMFWLLCVACTIRFAVACWTVPRLSTVHRKFFHLTIGMVVISGLLYDRSLTFLASVLMLDGFVVLEMIRLCEVEPIGGSLRDIFSKFLDHQDQGPLVLTPIYLLIGCFIPLWIDFPVNNVHSVALRHFAGLIAVGVGDAAAAIGGTYLGRTPWRVVSNGRKTVQGTLCGFLAQVAIFFCILSWIGPLGTYLSFGRVVWIIWSCFLVSMLETFSAQVDNLILPLFTYVLLLDW